MILPSNAPQVGVWDAFGTERFNITRDVVKQRVDHRGTQKGKAYRRMSWWSSSSVSKALRRRSWRSWTPIGAPPALWRDVSTSFLEFVR